VTCLHKSKFVDTENPKQALGESSKRKTTFLNYYIGRPFHYSNPSQFVTQGAALHCTALATRYRYKYFYPASINARIFWAGFTNEEYHGGDGDNNTQDVLSSCFNLALL
jgi:hypothetical protein